MAAACQLADYVNQDFFLIFDFLLTAVKIFINIPPHQVLDLFKLVKVQ